MDAKLPQLAAQRTESPAGPAFAADLVSQQGQGSGLGLVLLDHQRLR